MRHRQLTRIIIVGLLIAPLSGCVWLPESGSYEVDFDGSVERTDSSFQMRGQVEVDTTTARTLNFTEVAVVLYGRNRSVIRRVSLGPMSTDPEHHPVRRPVNITTDRTPTYVLIESPDFWQRDVAVMAYRWTGDHYYGEHITDRDEAFQA